MKMSMLVVGLMLMPISPLVWGSGFGISGGVGTLGPGLEVSYQFNDFLDVEGDFNNYSLSRTGNLKGVTYAASLKLSTQLLLINLYPFAGGFHLTGGWVHNGNSVSLAGQPNQSGNYTFNGNTYSAQQAGVVTAGLGFNGNATYLGIGWGGNGTWGVTFDLGAMYQGTPKFNLSATGAASNPKLASDVAQQQATTQSDVSSFNWYPQIRLGLYIRF